MSKTGNIEIIGLVDEIRSEKNSRIKVLSYKKGKEYIDDQTVIVQEFPPNGFVFAFNIYKYKVGTLLKVDVTAANYNNSGSNFDHYTADAKSKHHTTGYELLLLDKTVLHSELSVNMIELERLVSGYGELEDFYFEVSGSVYGPFDYKDDKLHAKNESGRCNIKDAVTYIGEGYSYLAKKPLVEKIDTMDNLHLSNWLKTKLKNIDTEYDIESLKTILEHQSSGSLDKVRMQRSLELLSEFQFSKTELQIFCRQNPKLQELFDKFLEKGKVELLQPLDQQKENLLTELAELVEKRKSLENIIQSNVSELELVTNDLKILKDEREQIIQDVRIHGLVSGSTLVEDKLIKYDILEFDSDGTSYGDFNDFARELSQSLSYQDPTQTKKAVQTIAQMSEHQCILSNNIEFILHIAQCSGNCKVVLQQVEADWLKFDHLFNNGLKVIWQSAFENPDTLHFLILEDFNLAAFECYSKPLTDVLFGRRRKLPTFIQGKPDNLFLFLIPIRNNSELEFGLPLVRDSYFNFGGFAKIDSISAPVGKAHPRLTIKQLKENLLPLETSLDDYFNAND